jgi:hypothetical protein
MQTRTVESALNIIETGNGLTKTVTVHPISDRCLDYILDQIQSPHSVRPTKNQNGLYRHYVFNPLTAQWSYRGGEASIRGRVKDGVEHTKKTSTSYMPTDGITEFFQPKNGHPVTLLFDVRFCNLKNEKYIFPHDAQTDQRWWLKNVHGFGLHNSIGFAALQTSIAAQRAQGIIPKPTELLVGLSKQSLTAIIVNTDLEDSRLRSLYALYKIKDKLGILVPILILTPQGFQPYTEESQKADLLLALKFPHAFVPQPFILKLLEMLPNAMSMKIKHELEHFDSKAYTEDMEKIFEDLPQDLQFLVLESIPFVDAAKIYYLALRDESTPDAVLMKMKNSLLNMSNAVLKNILKKLQVEHPRLTYTWNETDSTVKMLQKNRSALKYHLEKDKDLEEISICIFLLFMFHLQFIDNQKFQIKEALSLVFHQAVKQKRSPFVTNTQPTISAPLHVDYIFDAIQKYDLSFVQWLTKDIPLMLMPTLDQKIHCDITLDDSGRWSTFKTKHFAFSPLTHAAIYRRFDSVAYFIKQYPATIPAALTTLNSLKKLKDISIDNYKYNETWNYTHPKIISNAYTLITSLRPGKLDSSWTYAEKRLMETLLLEKLATLTTRQEITSFWEEHKDANYLNVRRHGFFDKVFRGPDHMCNGKRRVFENVNTKFATLR